MSSIETRHTGVPVSAYTLMHADEAVAIADGKTGKVRIIQPNKLPFGLRIESLTIDVFMDWLRKRVDNLQRSYMNKVYMARKVGRDFENILRDSCALSITDQFWVNRSDINMTWDKLQEIRDRNEVLAGVALSGNTANLNWEAAMQGATSLFATKGAFPKAILKNKMLKCGGTQEREWAASVIGKALDLPVQDVIIKNPSVGGGRVEGGTRKSYVPAGTTLTGQISLNRIIDNSDDTLVEIALFTSENVSLVHASELLADTDFGEAHRAGQHHRYFYDWLPSETLKREFERVLILNWLISNHDMHGENFGCLYCPKTFEIIGIAPSFDHNSADFDGTVPELDVPGIVTPCIKYHEDVISKIESGKLEAALNGIGDWLTPEQKNGVRAVGEELINLYKDKTQQASNIIKFQYMKQNRVMADVTADYASKKVTVVNYTDDNVGKPFGVNTAPTVADFEAFLEDRCFPKARYDSKLILETLGLDWYEPLLIVKKTHGRMVDDCYWLKFEGEDLEYERDIKF